MVKLVDTLGLGPSAFGRGGSSPLSGTTQYYKNFMGIFLLVLLFAILLSFFYSVVRAISWVPMWGKDIKTILDLADVKKDDKVYDLGCGDGKVVFAAADRGAKAEGLEISVLPYLIANARKIISRNKAKISFKDFWMTDLSDADLVYFFLIPRIYPKLKTKLEKDLKPGAKVIAYVWPIEGWEPTKVEKREKGPAIYLYEIK